MVEGEYYSMTDEEFEYIQDRCNVVIIENVIYCIFDEHLKDHWDFLSQYGFNEMPTDVFLNFCFTNKVKVFPVPMNLQNGFSMEEAEKAKVEAMAKFDRLGLLAPYEQARLMLEYCKFCLFEFKEDEEDK